MKPKYKLYDTQTNELISTDKGQCYADDNTAVYGGYLGYLQSQGRLEFRENIEVLTTEQSLQALDSEYQPQFTVLVEALGLATLAEDTALVQSIKENYTALKAEYDGKRGVING